MTKEQSHETEQPSTRNTSAFIRPMGDSEQRPKANPAILVSGESIEPWADIAVPCYPLQPRRSETQLLPGDECYVLSLALAPREQSCFGQSHCRNWVWWVPTPANMNWFDEAVHEWLIRKRGFRRKDLKSWSFRDLASKIVEVVTDDDRIVTARWKRELWDILEVARERRIYWHEMVREAMTQLRTYNDRLVTDQPIQRSPMPFMSQTPTPRMVAEGEEPPVKIPPDHWRTPEPDDVPWACLVLGMKIETLFRISRLLIPDDVWTELRELQHLIEDAVWAPIGAPEWPGPAMASIEDLKTWWSFIKQDLQDCGLLSTNETPGAPGTNAGGRRAPMNRHLNPCSGTTTGSSWQSS